MHGTHWLFYGARHRPVSTSQTRWMADIYNNVAAYGGAFRALPLASEQREEKDSRVRCSPCAGKSSKVKVAEVEVNMSNVSTEMWESREQNNTV